MNMRPATNVQKTLALIEKVLVARNASPQLVEQLVRNQVTSDDRKAIIEFVAAELCEKGFDADSEPTVYGQELERLIDYLNRPSLR